MRLLLVFALAINIAACATQQRPLSATVAASLKGRQVAMSARRPTFFDIITEPESSAVVSPMALGAVPGAFRAAVEASARSDASARIVRENAIADPAPYIVRQLSDDLQRRYGLVLAQRAVFITGDDPRQVKAAHPSSDLILDVRIDDWRLEPFHRGSSKYRLSYTAHVRLIDAREGVEIAYDTCQPGPQETRSSPNYDEFLANYAQRLKAELEVMARFCIDEFRSKVLTAGQAP